LLLLQLLVLFTYRMKERYFQSQRYAYVKLMSGYALWLLLFLVRAAGSAEITFAGGVVGGVAQTVVEALLLVGGVILAGSAILDWLPKLAAADLEVSALRNDLSLLKSIARAKTELGDSERFYTEVTRLLSFALGTRQVCFYRFRGQHDELTRLDNPQVTIGPSSAVHSLCSQARNLGRPLVARDGLDHDLRPAAALPVSSVADDTILMLIWNRGDILADEIESLLELVASQLTPSESSQTEHAQRTKKMADTFVALREQISGEERLVEAIHNIDSSLRSLFDYEILRVAVFDSRGANVTQYALGRGKNLLTERDKSISTGASRLGDVFARNETVIVHNLADSDFEDDRWLSRCGAQAAVTVPLAAGSRVVAAVTFGSATQDLSLVQTEQFGRELRDTLLPLIQYEVLNQQLVGFNRRILDMTSALKQLVTSQNRSKGLESLIGTVVSKFPATMGLIWSYDAATEKLTLQALSQAHDMDLDARPGSQVNSRDLFWHRQAIMTGRLIVVNQENDDIRMDETEEELGLLPAVQSALLVPLFSGQQPIGVMSIAEMRNPARRSFSLSETLFARGMASIAALTLQKSDVAAVVDRPSPTLEFTKPGLDDHDLLAALPQRLATPLTSIMARTEQLLKSVPEGESNTRENLEKINLQARRMVEEVRSVQEARYERLPV
jgi:transcriptional regulator with GAF, ATPase, and Fis domain